MSENQSGGWFEHLPLPALLFSRSSNRVLAYNPSALAWLSTEGAIRGIGWQSILENNGQALPIFDPHQPGLSGFALRSDGRRCRIEAWQCPVKSGQENEWVIVWKDHAEKDDIEEELASKSSIVDATTDCVATFMPDGSLTYINPAGRKMLGLDADSDISYINLSGLIPPKSIDKVLNEALPQAFMTKSWHGETELITREGELIPVSQVIIAHYQDSPFPAYYSTTLRDISERKAFETDLITARDDAQQGTRAKSEFLATMSHEIRTPLNGILGMAQLLSGTPLQPEQAEWVNTIVSSGGSLLTILNDILDFSKIDAGKMTLESAPFEASTLIQSCLRLLGGQAEQKGLTLKFTAENQANWFSGDASRVRQIVLNLIGNAVKFTEKGSVSVHIQAGEGLNFSVQDTGIGMSPEDQAHLFEEFHQADSSMARRFGGTGLGLAICLRLAKLMGGNLRCESTAGEGTCFFVNLPLPTHAPEIAVVVSREPSAPLLNLRILVAEDNTVNQMVIRKLLEREGCTITLAANGLLAVEAMRSGLEFDLIFMDCQMPEMDGYAATRTILAEHPHAPPIVALTANTLAEDQAACKEAGMVDFVSKPIVQQRLQAILAQCANGELRRHYKTDAAEDPSFTLF